jgi:hypothetical protein
MPSQQGGCIPLRKPPHDSRRIGLLRLYQLYRLYRLCRMPSLLLVRGLRAVP